MDMNSSEENSLEKLQAIVTKEDFVESLNLARKIGMYNSEAIFYVKNHMDLMGVLEQKQLKDKHEKLTVMIQMNFPKTEPNLIVANPENKSNHFITLLDIDLIQEALLEGIPEDRLQHSAGGNSQ